MTAPRRVGTRTSKTRLALLDVTERVMLQEGYGALTSRRIAAAAGVTPPLIHYYFPSLDDLFVAVLQRRVDDFLEQQQAALSGPDPLQALYDSSSDAVTVAFTIEMIALANHREAIRLELASYVERIRRSQVALIQQAQDEGRLDLGDLPVRGVIAVLTNAARGIAMEKGLGARAGDRDGAAVVKALLHHTRPR